MFTSPCWHKWLRSPSAHFLLCWWGICLDLRLSFLIRWLRFLLLSFKDSLFILDPSRLAHMCHMGALWLAHTCHMETSWLAHMCHMKTSWLAHICHICTSQLSTHTSHRYLFPFLSSKKVFGRTDFNFFSVFTWAHAGTHMCVCMHLWVTESVLRFVPRESSMRSFLDPRHH